MNLKKLMEMANENIEGEAQPAHFIYMLELHANFRDVRYRNMRDLLRMADCPEADCDNGLIFDGENSDYCPWCKMRDGLLDPVEQEHHKPPSDPDGVA